MTNVERLMDWFVNEVRTNGLRDVKFFPSTDANVSAEDAAGALLAALTSPAPTLAIDDASIDALEF